MTKEDLLWKISACNETLSLEEIKSSGYDFEVIETLFDFWRENDAMQLATAEEQFTILNRMVRLHQSGRIHSDTYIKIAPWVKQEMWNHCDIAYDILTGSAPGFDDLDSYVDEFKKYLKFINISQVGNKALEQLKDGNTIGSYEVLYLIFHSLSKTES